MIEVILRFIQLGMLLLPLKPMAQSRRGVIRNAMIDLSALTAAKAAKLG
jgi:hypothetical protein